MQQKTKSRTALAACLLRTGSLARAQPSSTPSGPNVQYPVRFAVAQPTSQIPTTTPSTTQSVVPLRPTNRNSAPAAAEPVVQTQLGPLVNANARIQFDGIGANGWVPSDSNMAVGPNHIVETVNVEWAVYNKSGNLLPGFPKSIGSLFGPLGPPCTDVGSDPIVLYDVQADRWLISDIGVNGHAPSPLFLECIAISQTKDPTGAYFLLGYSFGNNFNDYPKLSRWPTANNGAYLATYNLFAGGPQGPFIGTNLCALDRTKLLAGNATAAQICVMINDGAGGVMPSDLDGPTLPGASEPGWFVDFPNTNSLNLYGLTPNFANSTASLTGPIHLGVAPFNPTCFSTCIPQSQTAQLLDGLGDRLMYRLAYRNFGDHEAMVINHSVSAGSGVGPRWYEIRNPSTAPAIFQQGTFAPDATFRWMGSIGMDHVGDIAIGYSISSASIHPGIAYTGRTPRDAPGGLESEAMLLNGLGSQIGSNANRWGDYSSMQIDPSDDCTFWYTNQYLKANDTNWSTHIGSFVFPACLQPPPPPFTAPALWVQHGGSFRAGEAQYADVNGDGKADLIFQGLDNRFWVSLSTGAGFTPPALWVQHGGSFAAGEAQYADVNGDGKADLIFQGLDNRFWVSLSTGTGFTAPALWVQQGGSFIAGQAQYADVNGDGKADLIFQGNDNSFWVSLSTGSGFTLPFLGIKQGGSFLAGEAHYADVNGDGKADLIFQGIDNRFWVSLSTIS